MRAYNRPAMHHLVACIFCGGIDPNADSLLLQAAIAGGITTPWILRSKLLALVSRLRGRETATVLDDAACPLPYAGDVEPPTSER
jgi:hypothetical protein